MTTRDKVLELFKGPFRYDADGETVDDADGYPVLNVQTGDYEDAVRCALGELIAEAMTEKFNKEKA